MTTEADLWELETRSEAVYLDTVSEDGESAFIARLCRFPEANIAWTWLHVFHRGHVHSYTNHEVPCGDSPVDEDADDVAYQAGEFLFSRQGNRVAPVNAAFTASAMLHSGEASPHGEGVLPCEIIAEFQRELEGVQSRAGRSEVLGITRANLSLGDVPLELEARGHFHEQIQDDPRFTQPFTYATLRGQSAGCIFIRGTRGARGTLTRGGTGETITGVRIEPPGTIRKMEIELESGDVVRGTAVATYRYEIPIFHLARPGSIVTVSLDETPLSGCINDLVFGELEFDRL